MINPAVAHTVHPGAVSPRPQDGHQPPLAILVPISAFVALGFAHSIAKMYLIAVAMPTSPGTIPLTGSIPVTLGKIIGGGVFVAMVYWLVHLRHRGDGAASGARQT